GDIPGGANTNDYIFLLSVEEANKYFTSNSARIAENSSRNTENFCLTWWWLRSRGQVDKTPSSVQGNGEITGLSPGYIAECGIRPAMWITI
ncbi:MAG: DUF6273 domain-containing protein, partial [Oscillospiraceae bacterium]|nr:DUF6273 domain-containing protein [Oscillospiraceae bacterium]